MNTGCKPIDLNSIQTHLSKKSREKIFDGKKFCLTKYHKIITLQDCLLILIYSIFIYFVASRQIRRRVPYAGHLMSPRRLWLNKIPTLCDVVIEFPGN